MNNEDCMRGIKPPVDEEPVYYESYSEIVEAYRNGKLKENYPILVDAIKQLLVEELEQARDVVLANRFDSPPYGDGDMDEEDESYNEGINDAVNDIGILIEEAKA